MISNLRISVAELVVWALLATAGLTWISLRALDGAVWLMDWLRDRVTPLLEDDDELTDLPPGMDLPPERTWEQMTSHQLPLTAVDLGLPSVQTQLAADWDQRCYNPCKHDPLHATARCGPCHLVWPQLAERRERRAPWWEAEQRAAYESLGFDYPSGLMARVRELAP